MAFEGLASESNDFLLGALSKMLGSETENCCEGISNKHTLTQPSTLDPCVRHLAHLQNLATFVGYFKTISYQYTGHTLYVMLHLFLFWRNSPHALNVTSPTASAPICRSEIKCSYSPAETQSKIPNVFSMLPEVLLIENGQTQQDAFVPQLPQELQEPRLLLLGISVFNEEQGLELASRPVKGDPSLLSSDGDVAVPFLNAPLGEWVHH